MNDYDYILKQGEFNAKNHLILGNRGGLLKNFQNGNPLNIAFYVSALPISQALTTKEDIGNSSVIS